MWSCAVTNHRWASDRAWVDLVMERGFREIELCPRYNPERTEDTIRYAKSKGIGISLHVHHGQTISQIQTWETKNFPCRR